MEVRFYLVLEMLFYSSTALKNIDKPDLNYEKLLSLMEFEKITFF